MSDALKVLLVDDDDYYRGALRKLLTLPGYEVTEAAEGKGAQHILGVQAFDVVISDIRMPGMDGVELLKWIKTNHTTPVILITGFSEILETTEAFKLGAGDFLIKPFKGDDIVQSIQKVTRRKTAEEASRDLDHVYCRVPLDDFVTGSRIHFNIFIRISSTKYVRIAYRGEDISADRIRAYKSKGVQYVCMLREDFSKYVGFNLDLARRLRDSKLISPEKKRAFIRYTGEVVLESLYVHDIDDETFAMAKDFTQTALAVMAESDEAIALLDTLNSHADFLHAHSVAVSLYSVMIARELGMHSSPTLFKVSIGGLLHDIGLKEVPRETLKKSRAAMSQEERMVYESHPIRGMEILNQVRCAPGDAILIAYQHHEDCTGFGYPKKLSKAKTHPLARVISVADQFCEFAIKGPGSDGLSGINAITQMLQAGGERLDPDALGALKRIFNYSLAR